MSTSATRSVRMRRFVRQLHRWVGLLVAIQVLLWVSGGLIMSALKLDEVRGAHLAAKHDPALLPADAALAPLPAIVGQHPSATAATLTVLLGQPVYRLDTASGTVLLDAIDGTTLSPLPADTARALALADYAGTGSLASVEWVDEPELEFRGRELPLWRAQFADETNTTLYISPGSGQVVARRNDLWRVFDFVWMLHIMDYEEREDFNHPLLIATAATALLFVLTGLAMLFYSFRPRTKH